MPPTLSHSEVDALMDAIEDDQIDPAQGEDASNPESDGSVTTFDFTSQDRIVRGRMPTLDAIHGRLARTYSGALSDMLREEVEILVEPAQPMKLGEFLSTQIAPACLNVISFSPLLGSGLLCVQPDLFFALLNIVFGGSCQPDPRVVGRDFTPIELDFARKLVESWAREAAQAWSEVHPVKPAYLRTEVSPDHVTIGGVSDVVMASVFQVRLGEIEGKLELAIPYTTLDPLKPRLLEHHTDETSTDRLRWENRLRSALLTVPLRIQVELGQTAIRLSDLLNLKPGDIVRLNRYPDALLPLQVAARRMGWATPLEANGNLAFAFDDWRNHESGQDSESTPRESTA